MNHMEQQKGLKYTALVVDDNFFNRDIFRIALETAGYAVTEASDGVQGLLALADHTFNLLVLDLQMPRLDGRAVLRNIRDNPAHKYMHIVIVTANAHMIAEDVDNMADYVMHKPIAVAEFSAFASRVKLTSVPQG